MYQTFVGVKLIDESKAWLKKKIEYLRDTNSSELDNGFRRLNRISLRVFGQLLFPQCFGRYVLWLSSGVCCTREPTWNFELRHLLNPWGSPVLILLAITEYKC